VTILGLFGLIFTAWRYLANKRDFKLQTIEGIKYELINASWYLKFDGNEYFQRGFKKGLENKWVELYSTEFSNPITTTLNPINYSFIENYSLLPGMGIMGDHINRLVTGYLQWSISYNHYLSNIRAFIFSRSTEKNITLADKLLSGTELTSEEQEFTRMLLLMYQNLFFGIVGDSNTGHLYAHHKELQEALNKYEKTVGLTF
jgi:hypothetical protein